MVLVITPCHAKPSPNLDQKMSFSSVQRYEADGCGHEAACWGALRVWNHRFEDVYIYIMYILLDKRDRSFS